MKKTWSEIKEWICNAIQFTIFNVVMLTGFWTIYIIVWTGIGLPDTNWAMWLLFFLSVGSEWLFFKSMT